MGRGARWRPRHKGRGARADLRAVLHHQEREHRARSLHREERDRRARRIHRARERRDRRRSLQASSASGGEMSGRLLIVDDEKEFCELAAEWLKRDGFEPEWCLSAEEALSMHAVEEYDMVLADLHMDEMNGLELCQRIVGGTPDVPVVVMTAF